MAKKTSDSTIITKLTTANDVYEVLNFVRDTTAENPSQWKKLDFTHLCANPAQRQSISWTEILSNELLGELATAKLKISPPINHRGLKTLDRGGLSFAVSQRDSKHTQITDADRDPTWPAPNWYHDWTPLDHEFRQTLVSFAYEPTEQWPREFVTFVNPHKYVSDNDMTGELVDNQAYAWLRQLIYPKLSAASSSVDTSETVRDYSQLTVHDYDQLQDVHRLCYELIDNLRHAFIPQRDSSFNIPSRRYRSYVLFYTTRGGGSDSYNRLHIVVTDYGHGLVRTLLPKLYPGSSSNSCSIIKDLLRLKLKYTGRASGRGYSRIVEIVKRYSGKMHLTTGYQLSPDNSEAIRTTLLSDSDEVRVQLDKQIYFFGTTVHITLRILPVTSTNDVLIQPG